MKSGLQPLVDGKGYFRRTIPEPRGPHQHFISIGLQRQGAVLAARSGQDLAPYIGRQASDFNSSVGQRSLAGIGHETDDGTKLELRQRRNCGQHG